MSAKRPPATIDSLRRALAEAEATAGGLRAKLAKLEAAELGEAAPVFGMDLLWDAALPMSRQRSSKHRCRKAWEALPKAARPTIAEAIIALKAWNKSDQWFASDNLFAPGLHRFISDRMWETLPENKRAPIHRNMSKPQPLAQQRRGEGVTDPAEIARLLGIKPKPTLADIKPPIARGIHSAADIAATIGRLVDCGPDVSSC